MDGSHVTYWTRLCGNETEYDAFWDWQLTVNTTNPDLTTCFQNTVLVWVPCALLWLLTPSYAYYLNGRPVYHSWTSCSKVNAGKTLAAGVLTLASLFNLIFKLVKSDQNATTPAETIASVMLFLTFLLATFYTKWLYRKGMHTSGAMFLFWFTMLLTSILTVRSHVMTRRVPEAVFVSLCIQLALVGLQFLLSCVSDTEAPVMEVVVLGEEQQPLLGDKPNKPRAKKENPCPKETASILSMAVFTWFFGMFIRGMRRTLTMADIWDIMDEHSAAVNYARFSKEWQRELAKVGPKTDNNTGNHVADSETTKQEDSSKDAKKVQLPQPSLPRALVKTFLPYYTISMVLMCLNIFFMLSAPQLLQALIAFIEGGDPYSWKGYLLAVVMYFVSVCSGLTTQHTFDACLLTTVRMRSALVTAVYKKALVISNAARRSVTVGSIVNLVAVDLNMLNRMMNQLNYAWSTPVIVILSTVFLWQQIGASCLAGLGILLLLLPSNAFLMAKFLKIIQRKQMQLKEERLNLTSQILSGVKVLKLYAWEEYFERQLEAIRARELTQLRRGIMLVSGTYAVWMSSSFLVTLACFVTYTLSSPDHVLDAQKTFVSMALINIMNVPLMNFSMVMGSTVQGLVSLKRVEAFLLKGEMDSNPGHTSKQAISIKDGTFTWNRDDMTCLKNINMDVKRGELVAIVGTVGSGKSSLVSAMLGEMTALGGSVSVEGTMAYVPQQAWIQNMTLRDNVLFLSPMNGKKYGSVIDACALRPDLDIIPGGDMTEIGEKGINLSGGQKQRVSLARAVYSDKDIYLLDDPLSAVDSHVGKQLFEQVIGPQGMLAKKTRILVTHGIGYLPQMDRIVVMKDGCISEVGTYEELLANDAAFAEFLRFYMPSEEEDEEEEEVDILLDRATVTSSSKVRRRKKTMTSATDACAKSDETAPDKLIEEETASLGKIKLAVLHHLLKAAEWLHPLTLLASVMLFITSQCLNQFWLSAWSRDASANGTQNEELLSLRLGVYGGLAILQVISVVGVSLSIAFGMAKVSFNLHHHLLHSVLRCPMSFFDTTPLGRILNRFSRDTDAVDQMIPMQAQIFLSNFVPLVSAIIIVMYTMPICGVIIAPLVIVFLVLQRMYITCACQLQRLDAISRSPMYAFLEESITGAPSIRAYNYQKLFTQRMEKLLDTSQSVWFEVLQAPRCLNAPMQIMSNLIVAATAVFGVLNRETMDPSSLGMALSFVLQVGTNLTVAVRFMSELEVQIVSVERIKEYSELESEAPWNDNEHEPPQEWPDEGAVDFQNYQTRYRPGLELVLKGIDCRINPREKVGIVGRTGAGKSSLTLALFRLIEADGGVINIDGRDISKMGLHDVRGRISIIPQDPVLFSGSLHFNLDPSGHQADCDLWDALEHAHLKQFVVGLPDGLQHTCEEGGGNLSVGQRQLVCLARALLRKSKILVLDEATAAVDLETDDLIQATIRAQFKDCTVITIAHRLNTVMDYDRVIVMEDGHIKEFDSPRKLTADSSSKLYAMAKDANLI